MDEPFKYLGRGHRVMFHDSISAFVIARSEYPGDENAVLAALNHITLDETCTQDPEYKRFLERMAKLDMQKRKRRRKKRKKKEDDLERLIRIINFLSKLD